MQIFRKLQCPATATAAGAARTTAPRGASEAPQEMHLDDPVLRMASEDRSRTCPRAPAR
jgi:hypothetical protein